ncbi:MAG: tripartite tricarboxylate transporter substrate binding protein [Betaproteobacteria bacterium]|jgi:tripartite-type tricarboxylate transporter receptor subunit TctC|nr:tripartite tricarboxylate transporter substrate binding protein [Betaproteobacteria bacterium]
MTLTRTDRRGFLARAPVLALPALFALPGAARAQSAAWPQRAIRIIVPYAAGGPADVTAREVAQRLSTLTGQSVVIDNQGGGLGLPSLNAVVRAEPDGHTLWMPALGNAVLQPLLSKQGGSRELIAKLRPVGMVSTSVHVLVVSATLPVRSVRELIDHARANPGRVSFASAGVGGTAHLAMEMFRHLTQTDVVHVPYKGSAGAVNDLVSGRVSAMFSSLPSLQGVADKGLVRVIAATAPSTSRSTRALPLMSATLPGFEYSSWYALYAPQATTTPVVQAINAALQKVLKDPTLEASIETHGLELLPTTPDEVQTWVRRDTEKWSQIIRQANITLD